MHMISALQQGKRIINFDETWLGMSDFRFMRWCQKGSSNSLAKKQLQPRISMLTALDTNGRVYLSLVQNNTNTQIIKLFFRQLAKRLDKEDKNWRASTVIMLDNAAYHVGEDAFRMYNDL